MRTCTRCNQAKNENDFNKGKKGKLGHWCRGCFSIYNKTRYKNSGGKIKDKLVEQEAARKKIIEENVVEYLKQNPCVKCGENNLLVLDFDHTEDNKEFDIATAIWSVYSWKRIEKEIAKCQVLCSNCHRIKTAHQLKVWKLKYI